MARGCAILSGAASYASLDAAVGTFTVGAWFCIARRNAGTDQAFFYVDADADIGVRLGSANQLRITGYPDNADFSTAPPKGEWFYLALVVEAGVGGTVYHYDANGVQQDAPFDADWLAGGIGAIIIGNNASGGIGTQGWEYDGLRVAQARVWSTALTEAQIEAELASTLPVITGSLVDSFENDPATDGWTTSGVTATTEGWPPNYAGVELVEFVSAQTYYRAGTATSVSESITVPQGADFVLLLMGGFRNEQNWLDASDFTLNGVAFTNITDTDNDYAAQGWSGYIAKPVSGTFEGTYLESSVGMTFTLLFFRNVDPLVPIRASDQGGYVDFLDARLSDLSVMFLINYNQDGQVSEGVERSDVTTSGSSGSTHGIAAIGRGLRYAAPVNGNAASMIGVALKSRGSLVVNSATDRIRRTANLPVSTSFSAGAWVKFTNLRGTWATAFELHQDGGNYIRAQLNSIDVIFADSGQLEGNPKYAVAADQWYYLGVSCSGTAEGDFLVRLWDANGALLTTSIGQTNNFTSAYNMDFGNGVENTYQNAKFAYGRVWDAALSRAEFEKEMTSATPVRTANLNTAFVDTDLDISGNARNWTLENVVWDVDAPTLPQNAPRPTPYYYRTLGVT